MTETGMPQTWDYVELLDDPEEDPENLEARAVKEPYGKVNYADPGKRGDKKRYPVDTEKHVRAAWSYINMPKNAAKYSSEALASIKAKIRSAMKRLGIKTSEDNSKRSSDDVLVETRTGTGNVDAVDMDQRIVTVIVVPYEQETEINYRQEIWKEVFSRTAFNGLNLEKRRIVVNREHNPELLVGKVIETHPDHNEGLVTDIKISHTDRGDDTLELARDGVLSASAGFMVKGRVDQTLDRRSMTRRIHRAFLDHVALVGTPAYEGARIMAFRNSMDSPEALLPPLLTPRVDDWLNDPIHQWACARIGDD